MRSTFKVLFYVNGSKEKNGIVPIMGRVTINGSVAQFSCKCSIPKELWDAKGNRAKGKSKEARGINLSLDNIKAQIIKHYQRLSDREAYVTADMVRNAYQGIGTEYETLLGAFDKDNESFKKRIGIDRALSSYQVRVRARNHLASFIKKNHKRNDISMLELTPDFIKEYEIYLSTDAGLHNGSVWANCMWLKTIVAKAYIQDENFGGFGGDLSMWRFYNLLTGANKSSYIDSFLDRSLNATEVAQGINMALHGDERYSWFID